MADLKELQDLALVELSEFLLEVCAQCITLKGVKEASWRCNLDVKIKEMAKVEADAGTEVYPRKRHARCPGMQMRRDGDDNRMFASMRLAGVSSFYEALRNIWRIAGANGGILFKYTHKRQWYKLMNLLQLQALHPCLPCDAVTIRIASSKLVVNIVDAASALCLMLAR